MPVINESNTTKLFGGYVERNNYQFRVIARDFVKSAASGEPMIVLETELVSPETCVGLNGETIQVAGAKWKNYLSFSPKAAARSVENLKALGIVDFNTDEDVAKEMIKKFDGMVFQGIASSDKDELCKPATPEQKANGIKIGEPILDSNGQKIITYKPKIERYLGVSTAAPATPY